MVGRGRLPSSPIKSRVRQNTQTFAVTRPSATVDNMGVVTREDTDGTHNANLWVHTPSESITQTIAGERTDASLMATMLPTADFEKDDRIDYDGTVYEAGPVMYHPSEQNKVVKVASLVRRHVQED